MQQKSKRAAPQHFLSDIDPIARVATCAVCGPHTPLLANGNNRWKCGVKYAYQRVPLDQRKRAVARHLLSDIDVTTRTATCAVCGPSTPLHVTQRNGKATWACGSSKLARRAKVPPEQRKRSVKRHFLSDIDPWDRTATCAVCGPSTPLHRSGQRRNGTPGWTCAVGFKLHRATRREELRQYAREYAARPEVRERRKKARYPRYFKGRRGITQIERRRAIEANDGTCEICHERSEKTLAIDHDHVTGRVRGLLCHRHNMGLGYFGDSIPMLEAAIAYLLKHKIDHTNPF